MLAGGEYNGLGYRNTDFGGQAVVEKLFVGTPPKGVVDNSRAAERCVFQESAIERNILRNAINDHIVSAGFALNYFVDTDRLSYNAFYLFAVNALNKCCGKTSFLAK